MWKKSHSNILPHKSWHVLKGENIAKVKADEEKDRDLQQTKLNKLYDVNQEARYGKLLARKRQREKPQEKDEDVKAASPKLTVDHIDVEEREDKAKEKALQVAREKGVELGWGSGQLAGDRKSFWQMPTMGAGMILNRDRFGREFDEKRAQREQQRLELADPLRHMSQLLDATERQAAQAAADDRILRVSEINRRAPRAATATHAPPIAQRSEERRRHRKGQGERKHRHRHKSRISHGPSNAPVSLEVLRSQRKAREKKERQRVSEMQSSSGMRGGR